MGIFNNSLEVLEKFLPGFNVKRSGFPNFEVDTKKSGYKFRPYTHQILEKNTPGLKIKSDGTYTLLNDKAYMQDNIIYPGYDTGKVFGLSLNHGNKMYYKDRGLSITPYENSEYPVVTGEVNPVNLPEVEREEELDPNVKSVEETKREIANRKRAAYNQVRGITSADAYAKQKELRDAGYEITHDGYWGDASAAAWEDYMQTKAANMTPKMETPSLAVAPSVTKPGSAPVQSTPAVDPNSPEAARQRAIDQRNAALNNVQGNSTSQMAAGLMQSMKANEVAKQAELQQIMQQNNAGADIFNTDPHNIQGGYVVPKEKPIDHSKMATHTTDTNPFGFITADPLRDTSKFYQKGGEVEEKPKMISISGPNYNETMVEGTDSTGTNRYQFREVEQQGDTAKVLYMRDPKTGQIIAVPADSRFNKDFEWMIRNAEPVNEYKKGGSLKKCSCGCKTLLKRGKGGKVMESRNCK